jgi:hypothetical protein
VLKCRVEKRLSLVETSGDRYIEKRGLSKSGGARHPGLDPGSHKLAKFMGLRVKPAMTMA